MYIFPEQGCGDSGNFYCTSGELIVGNLRRKYSPAPPFVFAMDNAEFVI
jgi:hypothetical protein